jgi:hypothetical protein
VCGDFLYLMCVRVCVHMCFSVSVSGVCVSVCGFCMWCVSECVCENGVCVVCLSGVCVCVCVLLCL